MPTKRTERKPEKKTEKKQERDDDFGVWMFKHGKGKEVAKHLEEVKKKYPIKK